MVKTCPGGKNRGLGGVHGCTKNAQKTKQLLSLNGNLAGKLAPPFDCIAILGLMSSAIVPIYLGESESGKVETSQNHNAQNEKARTPERENKGERALGIQVMKTLTNHQT